MVSNVSYLYYLPQQVNNRDKYNITMDFQDKTSIKSQIELLNSEVNSILNDNESLNPDALLDVANTVKDIIEVPATELAVVNEKLASTAIENNQDVLREAIGSVADLKELLRNCHGILNQVYTQIASLDISEPRMIEAAAAFITAMKETIQSFVDLYRDEQNFLHNVMLKRVDFEHKKQLIKYKHDLEQTTDVTDISAKTFTWSQEEMTKIINGQVNP